MGSTTRKWNINGRQDKKFIKELKNSPVDSQNAEIKGKLLKEVCLSEF